jgi:hypothetical protein
VLADIGTPGFVIPRDEYFKGPVAVPSRRDTEREGWLERNWPDNHSGPEWVRRWFVLGNGYLFYLADARAEEVLGCIPLEHATVAAGGDSGELRVEHPPHFVFGASLLLHKHPSLVCVDDVCGVH